MDKQDIQNRDDVFLLVNKFYSKVRKNELLGPIFNKSVNDWDAHIQHLTTFWESSLFITRKLEHHYKGNPLEVHVKVDRENDLAITELHFGIWLNLWIATLDELYEGENAENAKRRARKMGTFMYMNIFKARQTF